MDDIIKSLASDAKDDDRGSPAIQGNDLLGSLLGGLTGAGQTQPSEGSNPMGLLGGLLGGSGSGGILGGLLGGGQSANSPLVSNIAAQLSQKLKLDPAIAAMVVTFAISKLLPMITGALTGQSAQATPVAPAAATPAPAPAQGNAGLGGLLQTVLGNKTVSSNYLRSTGLTQELSQQAGIDTRTADKSLKQTFKLLGEQMAGDESMAAISQLLGR